MTYQTLALQDIYRTRSRISPIIRRTPLIDSPDLSRLSDSQVQLKMENLQVTGSFKIRGAANKVLTLDQAERQRGVITVSSGNHGRAVSYLARQLGVKAIVCLPETVPQNKVESIRELGADVIVRGGTYDQATAYAEELCLERKLTMVPPFDDPFVIAGQGTIGLELIEDYADIDTVIVPLSGGGLLSGIAFTLKCIEPSIHTVGVTMDRGAAMVESLKAGHVVEIEEEPTLADALAGGLGGENKHTFEMIREYVDETVLVSEQEIAAAMTFALEKLHVAVEGGGAVGIAALLHNKLQHLGNNIAVVVSGGNVDLSALVQVASRSYQYQPSGGCI